jgi:hypothetical protein
MASITPEICGTSAPTSIRASCRCYRRGSLVPPPIFVPKADADGNDIAGVRLPEVTVPVATYTGWALRADGLDNCDAVGQRIAFARTKAERLAAGDPRPSLEERYVDHGAYVSAVTAPLGLSRPSASSSTRTSPPAAACP